MEEPFGVEGKPTGEELLQRHLDRIKREVENYYGALIQIANRLRVPVPDEIDALIVAKQVLVFGMPLYGGSIMEQPDIWMREIKICLDAINIFERQIENAQKLQ